MSSSFQQFKKQASFFLQEKIRTARLALTDVTPTELLTEEATNGNPWAPDARTMGLISRAAFEIDDYWRIVEVLHKRLAIFDRKQWREPYQAIVLMEHLLTHGPESVVEEFQCDREVIQQLGLIQYIDERGFNWGLAVRTKSERVLELLEKGQLLSEERERARARKISSGIQGFGNSNHMLALAVSKLVGNSNHMLALAVSKLAVSGYVRSNSHYEAENQEENLKPDAENAEQLIDVRLVPAKIIPPEESKPLLPGETEVTATL